MALRVDLTGPVLRLLTKDKRTASGHGKTDVDDPYQTYRSSRLASINIREANLITQLDS